MVDLCFALQQAQRDDLLDSDNGHLINDVALMFVSPDHGILLQEYQEIDSAGNASMAAQVTAVHAS